VRHNLLATPLSFGRLTFSTCILAPLTGYYGSAKGAATAACCVRCKKFLIFLFKHLTKRASATPTAHPTKKIK